MDALGADPGRQVRLNWNSRLGSRQLVGDERCRPEGGGDPQPLVSGGEKYSLVFRPRPNIGKPVGGGGAITRPGANCRQLPQVGHVLQSAMQHASEYFIINAA